MQLEMFILIVLGLYSKNYQQSKTQFQWQPIHRKIWLIIQLITNILNHKIQAVHRFVMGSCLQGWLIASRCNATFDRFVGLVNKIQGGSLICVELREISFLCQILHNYVAAAAGHFRLYCWSAALGTVICEHCSKSLNFIFIAFFILKQFETASSCVSFK